jgi:hypothetical protein
MNAFEDFVTEIREFYDLDTVFPYRVGQAYAKAAAELSALRAAVGRLEGERQALREALRWIAANDPKGNGDAYWHSEQSGVRAAAALAADGERAEAEAGTCQCAYPRVIPGQFFTCINCGRPFRIPRT